MSNKRSLVRRTVVTGAAGAAALVLAACGGGTGDGGSGHQGHGAGSPAASPTAPQGRHNAADVAFATGMIPHHRQAVEMADLAKSRAESPEVKKLAREIERAQGPEIEKLSGWLESWGEEVPPEGGTDHSMHGMDMQGMIGAEDMKKLKESSGKAFDTAFMKMMIEHHEGAVAMAGTEKAEGEYEAARKMADDIIAAQTAEIARMNKLLGKD